ncbi:MAG: hypothetical protein H3C27_01095 [Opitutaceae bacterium]|nr:hypothetical protein [Opitutaceae bacterium]
MSTTAQPHPPAPVLPEWTITRPVKIGRKVITLTMTPPILWQWRERAAANRQPNPGLLDAITTMASLIAEMARPTHPHITVATVMSNLTPQLARAVADMFREAGQINAAALARN